MTIAQREDRGPVDFRGAILAQPENLELAARAYEQAVAGNDLGRLGEGTLIFSAVGASALALHPALWSLRACGRRAFAVSAAELGQAAAAGLGDAYVLVSQSGASAELVQALEALRGAPVITISAHGDSPLARAADVWLPLGPMPDTPVSTLSYTATLQALGMLCDSLRGGGSAGGWAWAHLPALAAEVLRGCEPHVEELAARFATVSMLDAVGAGPAVASAGETALLAREALKLPSTGMETREYLHGPLEAVGPGFGCLLFGRRRERELAVELASHGADVAVITDAAEESRAGVIALPQVPELAAAVLQILPVQLLVEGVARLRGLEIGALARHQPDTKVA